MILRVWALWLCLLHVAWCWDLLGQRNQYKKGQKVDLIVNNVVSDHSKLSFGYYSLPFVCPPTKEQHPVPLSLSEILRGDRKYESAYNLEFGVDKSCERLCDFISRNRGIERATELIKKEYVVNWEVDGLPGATTYKKGDKTFYAAGFPLGFVDKRGTNTYINNHFQLVFRTHRDESSGLYSIVGFEVYPKSVSNEICPGASKFYDNFALPPTKDENGSPIKAEAIIPWTYSVYWREDKLMDYERRWDLYTHTLSTQQDLRVHWVLVLLTLTLILLMTFIVTVVAILMLQKDLKKAVPGLPTDALALQPPAPPKWKLLTLQVLTRPFFPLWLSTLVAMGIQMFVALFGALTLLVINFWFFDTLRGSVAVLENHQGPILSLCIAVIVLSGMVLTYGGVLFHKLITNHLLNQPYSKKKIAALLMMFAGALPSMVVGVLLILNFFVWAQQLSMAIPFGTIVSTLLFLGLVAIPLGAFGGYYANSRRFDPKSFLVTVSGTPLEKPVIKGRKYIWITNPVLSTVVFGILPFMLIYVELTYVFHSLWIDNTTYYMYGFLLLSLVLLVILVAECTIVAIFISLAVYNDPNWQWLAFRCGALVGGYVMAYATYYFFMFLDVTEFTSILIYFCYMGLTLMCLGVACGALAVLVGLVFIKRVFGAIKDE